MTPYRVLFVCSGNICRSPLAEAIFQKLAAEAGLGERFEIDSAGTHDFHEGDRADPRARRVGQRHGLEVTSIARPVAAEDFERFHLVLAMDRGHLRELRARCPPQFRDRIKLMREFDGQGQGARDVPDPYYADAAAFEGVYELLLTCCRDLLAHLRPPLSK